MKRHAMLLRRPAAVLLPLVVFSAAVFAQGPSPAGEQATPAAEAQAAPASQPASAPAASPVPQAVESWLTGSLEIGYRWRSNVDGSLSTYRTVVDLGSGPKLISGDFTIANAAHRFFDTIRVRAYNWGDDPWETLHVDVQRNEWYRFNADYRSYAYFNNLPSYADPLLGSTGIALNEQSFDQRRKIASFNLDLLPGRVVMPYIAWDRNSNSGTGVSTFVSGLDEFAVPILTSDRTNNVRGGVRINLSRVHLTLEEGGTNFRSDQDTYKTGINYGNSLTPFLGQKLYLTSLLDATAVRGQGIYSRALFTANPVAWMDVFANFLFSQPHNSVNYLQYDSGSLALLSQALLFNTEQYLVYSSAKQPHTTANAGVEIRPLNRVRVIESIMTDRFHDSGASVGTDGLMNIATLLSTTLQSTLSSNYNENQTDVFFDVTKQLTLRGGFHYAWGDARNLVTPASGLPGVIDSSLTRRSILMSGAWRAAPKLSLSGEAEIARSDGAWYRTSLYNYEREQLMARYQITNSLNVHASALLLANKNPIAGTSYRFETTNASVGILWAPAKKWDFDASYDHCSYHSQISYLVPQLLSPAVSIYRDNCHNISALFNANLKGINGNTIRVMAGGSVVKTSGSRPTAYYEPQVKVTVPLTRALAFFAEWRYYGFGEAFYLYEGFHAHLLTTGLRFTK